MSTTAVDIKDALHRRYGGADLTATQWVCIEEARAGAGFDGNAGRCDFLAINSFKGRGMELIGHEIKVSLSDWKAELADPSKAEQFARYFRRWYVVVPAALAAKIKDEVPPAWGLMKLSDKGRLTEVRKAPARKPEDVPLWWWVGWLAQIDRQVKKRIPAMVAATLQAERERVHEQIERSAKTKIHFAEQEIATLRTNAEALKQATGLDVLHLWPQRLDKLRQAWALVESGYDIEHLVTTLRHTADALDGLKSAQNELELKALA